MEEDTCEELTYKVNLQATTGRLRFSYEEDNAPVKTEITIEGNVDEVNDLLAKAQFMPACDDSAPGILNLVVSAYA